MRKMITFNSPTDLSLATFEFEQFMQRTPPPSSSTKCKVNVIIKPCGMILQTPMKVDIV